MVVGVALLAIVTASMAAAFAHWTASPAERRAERNEAAQTADLAAVIQELRKLRAEVAQLRRASGPVVPVDALDTWACRWTGDVVVPEHPRSCAAYLP